jgi:hypothetical protein
LPWAWRPAWSNARCSWIESFVDTLQAGARVEAQHTLQLRIAKLAQFPIKPSSDEASSTVFNAKDAAAEHNLRYEPMLA